MRLAGKVVVVTGAGSGLGQALALELLRRGARVAAVDLRSEGLQETMAKAGSLGEGLSLHPLDITDKEKVAEAERQIRLILNPPTAEVGQVYQGRVVNVTKFGAFVNILPGRDGLLHISKIGGGKRIDKVEDVLDLGDAVEVRVDDVDPNGKVSLSMASTPVAEASEGDATETESAPRESAPAPAAPAPADEATDGAEREYVSFEDAFDAEISSELGDLGPASENRGGGDRNGGRRGGNRRR